MDTGTTSKSGIDDINARFGSGVLIEPAAIGGINGGKATDGNSGSDGDGDGSGAGGDSVRFNKDGSIRKKRGRKPGSGNSAGSASPRQKKTPDGISSVLFSLHAMAASFLKTPELELDKSEADALAVAIDDVQRFYDVQTSAEVLLWVNVIGVCAAVYGPRIGALVIRKRNESERKPRKPQPEQAAPVSSQQSNVVTLNNGFDYPPPE